MPKQKDVTKDRLNKLGGRTTRIVSSQTFSFSQYNRNAFFIVDEELDTEWPAIDGELSELEKGHHYVLRRLAEDTWEVVSPYRYADKDTSVMFPGVRPEPTDAHLLAKFGQSCHKWEAITDKFRIPHKRVEIIKQRIRDLGGTYEILSYNMALASKSMELLTTMATRTKQDETDAKIKAASGELTLKELETTRDACEVRRTLMAREADNVRRHHNLSKTVFSPAGERKLLNTQVEQAVMLIQQVKGMIENLEDLTTTVLQNKVKSSGEVTLASVLQVAKTALPALEHLRLEGEDLLIEYEPGRFVKITKEGASLWTPKDKKKAAGRFGKLEV